MTELTKDQEAKLEVYIKEWTAKGFATRDEKVPGVTEATVAPIVREAYKAAGYAEPESVTMVDSPLEVVAAGLILFCLEDVVRDMEAQKTTTKNPKN